MKISIHIHSGYSMDSKQSVSLNIEKSRQLGFDAIAITDHNTVFGSMAAARISPPDLKIIIGAEFSTEKGHILALFINDEIERNCIKRENVFDFEDLVSRVRQQGGLLFLAHPLQSAATHDHSFIQSLDGYELINARINSSHRNKQANRLSDILKVHYPDKSRVGGSDAHTKSEIKSVYMTAEHTDPLDDTVLKEALLMPETICFRQSSMAKIRWSNIVLGKKKGLSYCFRQFVMSVFGLLYDLNVKIKGDSYEVIRVRKEDK